LDVVILEALGITLCLVLSAFFSGSETALTSLSGPQAQKLIEEKGYTSLKLWLSKPIEVITTILIGNNIVNTTASALATDITNRLLDDTPYAGWAIPAAVFVITLLLLTFGEITPKAIAKKASKQIAPLAISLLRIPYFLFTPFTAIFNIVTQWIMRKLGNDVHAHAPFVTAEEIEYMIDLGSREGSFPEGHERMLRTVFDLNDTLVREIMVPRTNIIALPMSASYEETLRVVASCGHSRIPVYKGSTDNIIGVFYVKDLIPRLPTISKEQFSLLQIIRKPVFVPESKRLADMLAEFQRQRIHMAILVDEFGGTAGLITLEDIVEEFFGEIRDEYDMETDLILRIDDDTLRADARASIYDIEEFFEKDFPDEIEYDTVGGFLMAQLGTVPLPGEEIPWENLVFRVLESDEKRVIRVEIERLNTLHEPSESSGS
jgi:putative hemolysin